MISSLSKRVNTYTPETKHGNSVVTVCMLLYSASVWSTHLIYDTLTYLLTPLLHDPLIDLSPFSVLFMCLAAYTHISIYIHMPIHTHTHIYIYIYSICRIVLWGLLIRLVEFKIYYYFIILNFWSELIMK